MGPIMKAVKAREDMINNALESAEKAREEMKVLQADNADHPAQGARRGTRSRPCGL